MDDVSMVESFDEDEDVQVQRPSCLKTPRIGISSEPEWKLCAGTSWAEAEQRTDQNSDVNMINYFQSLSCVDPGVYKGKPNKSFHEFIRRFGRKYRNVVGDEQTLIDILVDDHLGGRAKSTFLSLPVEVRRKGFDEVDAHHCATAGIKNPGQDVAEFCLALEKLGRKAYPDGSMENRSLEFVQMLLSNLKSWPEHVHVLSFPHGVRAEKAYEEVKQLALSIETSKRMHGQREMRMPERTSDWRVRSRYYKGSRWTEESGRRNTVNRKRDVSER
ncbi:hypothetical protein OESDEN_02310 [Oesophagostomum dentatum]|uniref:Uncharacterized protein n=1 Tax=Oesophagostomum dentatum TaxID=61180 RepID=A0A0B1TPH4_OESDE|nr:hypothetical protein OESDEN_02310 [Oesophagostomum dentatum]